MRERSAILFKRPDSRSSPATGWRLSTPSDTAEREAERMATAALAGRTVGDGGAAAGGGARGLLHRSPAPGAAPAARASAPALRLAGGGRPLPAATRVDFEQRFGHDFGRVRVHSDAAAAAAARDAGARAFATGEHVAFAHGRLRPDTAAGRRLLAHELAHVVQQRRPGGAAERTLFRNPDEAWIQDREGNLYYKTREEAERRKAALEAAGEFTEYRIVSFERKGETFWRVEMRGRKQAPAPPPGSAQPPQEAPKEQPKEPAPPQEKPKEPPPPQEPPQEAPKEGGPDAGAAAGGGAGPAPPGGATRTFALTFDDGPHSETLGTGANRTEKVLDTLKAKGVKGAFFIQTGVSFRGASAVGKQLVQRMHSEGHKVGIHTGGTIDHESHVEAQKAGRLEGELKSAKSYITTQTGETPALVRPPFGASNKAVRDVYAKVSLTNLLWDIDGDKGAGSVGDLKTRLESTDAKDPGIPAVAARGWTGTTPSSPKIVVLYHDVRANTAKNIGAVIDHIKKVTSDTSGGKDAAAFAPP
jgi:peptidoglycan/xylan/chitin deacetylase (PgdA/CDA1 family)